MVGARFIGDRGGIRAPGGAIVEPGGSVLPQGLARL